MKIFATTLLLACALVIRPAPAQTLQQALEFYYQGDINESLEVFEQLHAANPDDTDLAVWLAENLALFSRNERSRELVEQALRREPCHSQALVLRASLVLSQGWRDPINRDSAWAHLGRAVECAPDDGNAWLAYWEAATMRRDQAAEERAQRRLGELRFIPDAAMELGRWMLRSAPPNAVLFANSDEDWVPIRIAQTAEGLRPDVTVVLTRDLMLPWYVRRVAAQTGYPVPPQAEGLPDEELLPDVEGVGTLREITGVLWAREWTEGRNPRPLVIAATANLNFVRDAAWLHWEGPLVAIRPRAQAPADRRRQIDADAFGAHLRHLDLARLNGPRVHPTDRNPVHHYGFPHPGHVVAVLLAEYGNVRLQQGRMDDARDALARIDQLRAAGVAQVDHLRAVDDLRRAVERRP